MARLLVIPAFLIGALAGAFLLGLLPGVVFVVLFYGDEAYRYPEAAVVLMRPGAIVGGCSLAILAFFRADDFIKLWRQ